MDVLLWVMSNCFSYVLFASVFVDVFFKGCFFWGEKIKKPTTFFVGLMMNKTLKLPEGGCWRLLLAYSWIARDRKIKTKHSKKPGKIQ